MSSQCLPCVGIAKKNSFECEQTFPSVLTPSEEKQFDTLKCVAIKFVLSKYDIFNTCLGPPT